MSSTPITLNDHLHRAMAELTATERKLVAHLLDHYPVAALGSITALAKGAEVSTPTVVRLVQKLGFQGYPDFHAALRTEVGGMLAQPKPSRAQWSGSAPEGHILNRFTQSVMANIEVSLSAIQPEVFDAVAELLADPARRVMTLGGRMTQPLAEYFAVQLQLVRPEVTLLSTLPSSWPSALLDLRAGDVLLIIDIRRYENTVLQMAELASEAGAEVILITDRWISPAATHARHTLPCHIEAPSAWDSSVTILALLETLLAAIQDLRWPETEDRLHRMEEVYARMKLFRRPR